MDTTIFEDLGLTNAEIKVYLALIDLGTSTAGPVLDKTRLQNSVVHMTLHKLVEKGFASFIKKGKIKHYQATDPKNLLKIIDDKKRILEEMLPVLLARQRPGEKQVAEIYEGFKGFKAMQYEFIKGAKKDDEYLFFSFYAKNPDDFENVYNFYNKFSMERKKLGIIDKGIVPSDIKNKLKGRNIRNLLFVDFPVLTNISVFRDKVILTPWEDSQISFLIQSRQLADSFRQYFYSIWNRYKK
jgi:sugar-specific transcriptional regulator TrmB